MQYANAPSKGASMTVPPIIPGHIAIVMDGNGRWAKNRNRPRGTGHQAGLKALRKTIQHCVRLGVKTLTVFAFSSENWNRPAGEVSRLMEIFLKALDKEVAELHKNGICVRFVGDLTAFTPAIQTKMAEAQTLTAGNDRMIANVALNYGGRWDITQAAKRMAKSVVEGVLSLEEVDEQQFGQFLALAASPDPDLFIRTGGEMRISNFLLWQSAYTEFYFSPVLWPDFEEQSLDKAIAAFQSRERRFGRTSDQVKGTANA
jgi:undecaprenyl diphosphate synthase